jgi:CHAT domain-containing protein/tetratricopeptide (TPR) repeat protein
MRHSSRLFGLMAGTALVVSASQVPGLSGEFRHLTAQAVAQTTQEDDPATVLLEVEGVLDEGDNALDDGRLVDMYPFEGQAGQSIDIRLQSDEFDTFVGLIFINRDDGIAEFIGENNNASPSGTNSRLIVTLPTDGLYNFVVTAPSNSGRGRYQLKVTEVAVEETTKSQADRLLQQGIEQRRISQFQEALQSFEQALKIYREIGARPEEGRVLWNLGGIYNDLGQYQQAIVFYGELLSITREINDQAGESSALGNLGNAYQGIGKYEQAINFYQQSLAISRSINDLAAEGSILVNLGLTYHSLGQYSQAIDLYEQSLAIAQEIDSAALEGSILGNLGGTYRSLGQYEQAIDLYERSLAIAQEIRNQVWEGRNLGNLGSTYQSLGQYERAINLYEQSLAMAQEIGDRVWESRILGNLGNAYSDLEQYEQAIDLYRQGLQITQEMKDRPGESATLLNLGNVYYDLKQYEQAINFYEQQIVIALEIQDRPGKALSLHNQGLSLIRINQFSQAENVLQQSIEVFESLRTGLSDNQLISIADTQARAYANLELALTAQDKTDEALAITERGRGRAFVLQLASRLSTEAERAALEASPVAQVPTAEEIQQIARDTNTTLVTYSLIFDQALYIWVVQPSGDIEFRSVEFNGSGDSGLAINPIASIDGPVYRGATDDSELTALVNDSRATIVVEGVDTSPKQLKELHEVLIDPIADLLPTDPEAKVAFIPQGSLFLVPFAALQDKDGTYLIEKHTILTASSIQVFGLANQGAGDRVQGTGQAVVVGNPIMPKVWQPTPGGDFAETQLSDLPGAKAEAEAIGSFLEIPVLTGDQATEARIKQQLPSAQLIHLATHGLLDYGDPQSYGRLDVPGAIALAPGDGEDGLLTSAEILDMDLQADLAILSACDTGRGRITGDGVVGLSRSLITAGVPSVVVSLWAVPDSPTAELMTEFYRQLDQGQDKAQALRQAMLTTMEQHLNPRDWAAFTLIGAAE